MLLIFNLSTSDSVFSHLAWTNTPRKEGGLGSMKIPILADTNHQISKAYGCLKEDEGIAFRGLYIIDRNGNIFELIVDIEIAFICDFFSLIWSFIRPSV